MSSKRIRLNDGTYISAPPPKFFYLIAQTNKSDSYLQGTDDYKNAAATDRVVTAQVVKRRSDKVAVEAYQQWEDRDCCIDNILARPPGGRPHCWVICPKQPTRIFVDLDEKPRPPGSTPERELAMVNLAIDTIEDVF